MQNQVDIYKAGGVIIKDRHFLVTRSTGKDFFIAPGGKLEENETAIQALEREMVEELQVTVVTNTLERLGTFYAEAAGKVGVQLQMDVYIINDYTGELTPSSEVAEMKWINTKTTGIQIGSIFEHEIMPLLKQRDLID
jgi:ADP-ribose pyrophosphatase YjhB (NUDIX family)